MASNPDFVQYIVDQCGGAGCIEARKMFGDCCLYCNGKPFGLVSDNGFYVKPTEEGKTLLRSVDMRPPYEGAKPYFYIEDVDDHDYVATLVKATCAALPEPKPKKKKQ
jgi:TfoX/Sxy family transcriptional regulator of competence genes